MPYAIPQRRRRRRRRRPPGNSRKGGKGPRGARGARGLPGSSGLRGSIGETGTIGNIGPIGEMQLDGPVKFTDPNFTLSSVSDVNGTDLKSGQILMRSMDSWINVYYSGLNYLYKNCISSVVNILQIHNGYAGSGSGFFIRSDGIILTAAHVVLSSIQSKSPIANEIWVHTYPENAAHSATVIGLDRLYDVALLKVNLENRDYLNIRDSREVEEGEFVVTLGQPLGTHVQSITLGVVRDRKWADRSDIPESIVSDYDTVGGNSGGVVLTSDQKVVGILSWGLAVDSFSLSGAIASHVFQPIVNYILKQYDNPQIPLPIKFPAAYMGISYAPVDLFVLRQLNQLSLPIEGYIVTSSSNSSLKVNDIITHFDGQVVGQNNNQEPLGTLIHFSSPGLTKEIQIRRAPNYQNSSTISVGLSAIPQQQDRLFNALQINKKKI